MVILKKKLFKQDFKISAELKLKITLNKITYIDDCKNISTFIQNEKKFQ